jgi:misacylated tRNA(Ala) deacylase
MFNPTVPATFPIYLQDDHCFESEARLLANNAGELAFDQTCFYPGGGGQPADVGEILFVTGPSVLPITSVRLDEQGVIWHYSPGLVPAVHAGQSARLKVDVPRRLALMRTHTVLHILNTIAMQDYQAWITGVQIGTDQARIDFNFEQLTPAVCRDLEIKVNRVITAGHALKAYSLSEEQFRQRPDLLRTLDVKPPIHNGRVRVVEISGFDAQACGGTHVHNTSELGIFSIIRTDNKGRNNKRLYIQLARD